MTSRRPAAELPPILKWHGGKGPLAARIVALMPPHLTYVEPYFGGGAVLLARDPADESLWLPPHKGVSEVVNDVSEELTRFWQVIRDPELFPRFERAVVLTPFSEREWLDSAIASQTWDDHGGEATDRTLEDVARAWAFFVRCRLSLAGRMDSFTGVTKTRVRRGMNNEVSAWLSCVEGLPAVHERLKRVLVLNRDALIVIRQMDNSDTLFYVDPPYLPSTRTAPQVYAHEMTFEQHEALLDALSACKAKVMLSGYRSDLYDTRLAGWSRIDWELPNNSAGNPAEGARKARRVESLWCNF